ncbi:MAG TPA: hypothetical protein VFU71_06925 [Burkholderiaceae bacterium]|nr:hypothetical protein [Burkholderiaceae bacterium]
MKKFLVLYQIPTSVMDEWKQTSADERKSAEDKMGREIQAWTGGRGKLFTDRGAGLGKAKRITSSGVSDARNDLVMYAIVQGESQDAVAKSFESHPHLQIPQSSIEVMELFALPDQPRK